MNKVKNIQEQNKKFFDKAVRFYGFFIVKKINIMIHKKILMNVNLKSDSTILDAGCGTGGLLELINKTMPKSKLYGIDISKNMVRVSRSRLGKKTEIILGSVEKMKFKNKFDCIINTDSFHHFANQERTMKNFHKALKKKGKLAVADFSFGKLGNKVFSFFEPGNSKMHTKKEFENLFRRHGFRRIKQKRIGFFSVLTIGKK